MAQESKQSQFPASDNSAVVQQPAVAHPSPTPAPPRPCPQNCALCGIQQQVYCSAKMLFDLSCAQQEAQRQIAAVEQAIADIRSQLQPKGDDAQLSLPLIESS